MQFANNRQHLKKTIQSLLNNIQDAYSMAVQNKDKDDIEHHKRSFKQLDGLMSYFEDEEKLDLAYGRLMKNLDECRSAAVVLKREANEKDGLVFLSEESFKRFLDSIDRNTFE